MIYFPLADFTIYYVKLLADLSSAPRITATSLYFFALNPNNHNIYKLYSQPAPSSKTPRTWEYCFSNRVHLSPSTTTPKENIYFFIKFKNCVQKFCLPSKEASPLISLKLYCSAQYNFSTVLFSQVRLLLGFLVF